MRRVIVGDLCATSVLLHVVVGVAAFFIARMTRQMAGQFAPESTIRARVTDVTHYQEADITYSGYAVDWDGKHLYVQGDGRDSLAIDDPVNLLIRKQEFMSWRSLWITAVRGTKSSQAQTCHSPDGGAD